MLASDHDVRGTPKDLRLPAASCSDLERLERPIHDYRPVRVHHNRHATLGYAVRDGLGGVPWILVPLVP